MNRRFLFDRRLSRLFFLDRFFNNRFFDSLRFLFRVSRFFFDVSCFRILGRVPTLFRLGRIILGLRCFIHFLVRFWGLNVRNFLGFVLFRRLFWFFFFRGWTALLGEIFNHWLGSCLDWTLSRALHWLPDLALFAFVFDDDVHRFFGLGIRVGWFLYWLDFFVAHVLIGALFGVRWVLILHGDISEPLCFLGFGFADHFEVHVRRFLLRGSLYLRSEMSVNV